MHTTLRQLKKHHACNTSMEKLINHLGKDYDENKSIDFKVGLKICGVKDCFWALCTQAKKVRMLIGADVAESVLPIYEKQYPGDNRMRGCIQGIRDFCSGKITQKDLNVLKQDAYAAAVYDVTAVAAAVTVVAYDAATAAAVTAVAYAVTAVAYAAVVDAAAVVQWEKNKKILLKYL